MTFTKSALQIGFALAITVVAAIGCSGGGVPSNEEELSKIKEQPSNNPELGTVDGANTEFGGGKPKAGPGG
jgi:hypothetical protein